MNPRDLPTFRLATTDSTGKRIYLYPEEVSGFFRTLRNRLSFILVIVFLALPWLRIAGHQAVLLDVLNRRFAIFGLTFWGHDAPMLLFLFGGAALTLGFVTAVWGRVWCGWGCPQTVFVDGLFRKVERWIEGNSLKRKALDQAPWSRTKLVKKGSKWAIFLLLSLILSHSFLAYFVGTEKLGEMIRSSPSQNPGSFFFMALLSALVLFDFGWFREQFCTLVCPYGRFQSVLMDAQSKVVFYDVARGEPRKGTARAEKQGDCVNCYRCVSVCPTGIDIRRGTQLECIACTACIDACDDVMTRLKKPAGLIRYSTSQWSSRFRVVAFGIILALFAGGLTLTVLHRQPVDVTLIRAANTPYQVIPGQGTQSDVVNQYKIILRNQTFDPQRVTFQVSPEFSKLGIQLVVSNHENTLAPGNSERADLFIRFPKGVLMEGRKQISLTIQMESQNKPETATLSKELQLVGPLL